MQWIYKVLGELERVKDGQGEQEVSVNAQKEDADQLGGEVEGRHMLEQVDECGRQDVCRCKKNLSENAGLKLELQTLMSRVLLLWLKMVQTVGGGNCCMRSTGRSGMKRRMMRCGGEQKKRW